MEAESEAVKRDKDVPVRTLTQKMWCCQAVCQRWRTSTKE